MSFETIKSCSTKIIVHRHKKLFPAESVTFTGKGSRR